MVRLLRFIGLSLLVALVYVGLGRAALALAIPPGYATAVWPSAAAALVACFIYGPRLVPAVVVGSFLVNISTPAGDASPVLVSALIALGAGMQALVGSQLLTRVLGEAPPVDDGPSILKFLMIGGPISCAVSASVGVMSLVLNGAMSKDAAAFSWFTWWAGDTIGVLLFAPALMAFFATPSAAWRPRRISLVLLVTTGLTASVALFVAASDREADRLHRMDEARERVVEGALRTTLLRYESIALSIAALFETSGQVTDAEFRAFTRRPLATYPGIAGLGFNPVVEVEEQQEFIDAARAAGHDGFEIFELHDGLRVPVGRDKRRVVVRYVEPLERNRSALGYDVSSEDVRRATLARAAESGEVGVALPIFLVQDSARLEPSFLLYAPAYAPGTKHLLGFGTGVFRMKDVVDAALRDIDRSGIAVSLYDEDTLLYGPASGAKGRTFAYGGKQLKLVVHSSNGERTWAAWAVLAGALAFASSLGAILLLSTGRTIQVQRLVEERTRALDLSRIDLERALQEKTVLIKEVHHRVKNNLQVIHSMLGLHARTVDAPVQAALRDAQQRLQSIALVHEQLYLSPDLSHVDLAAYCRSLVSGLFTARPGDEVQVVVEGESIGVAMETAIPCGLIVNELVTNALKHAFPDGRRGTIRVAIAQRGLEITVSVSDDGIGLPPSLDPQRSPSLGLDLVYTLSEQLKGKVVVTRAPGTTFEVAFSASPRPV